MSIWNVVGWIMTIGKRLRDLRQQRGLSQADFERATGLVRCYISRVEQGHIVPSLETLKRFAAGLDVPLYQLFYTGDGAPQTPQLTPRPSLEELAAGRGSRAREARYLLRWRRLIGKLAEPELEFVLDFARRLRAWK